MKVTSVKVYPVKNGSSSVRANGSLVLDEVLELKFTLVEGKNGLFVSWKGQEKYQDKEGNTKYSSPIMVIRNKDANPDLGQQLSDEIQAKVVAEYESKKD